jgi:hypothetical protein
MGLPFLSGLLKSLFNSRLLFENEVLLFKTVKNGIKQSQFQKFLQGFGHLAGNTISISFFYEFPLSASSFFPL